MSSGKADHAAVRRPVRRRPRAWRCAASSPALKQYQRNVDEAQGWMTRDDDGARRRSPTSPSARASCSCRAPPTRSTRPSRNAIADEIDQLIASIKQEANATYGGRYVFAGTATNRARTTRPRRRPTRPYDQRRLRRRRADQLREIGPGVTLAVNVARRRGPRRRVGRDGKLLDVLRDISTTCAPATPLTLAHAATSGRSEPDRQPAQPCSAASARARTASTTAVVAPAGDRGVDHAMLSNTEDADMAKTHHRTTPPSRPPTSRR